MNKHNHLTTLGLNPMTLHEIKSCFKNKDNDRCSLASMKGYLETIVIKYLVRKYNDNYKILNKVLQTSFITKFVNKYFNLLMRYK